MMAAMRSPAWPSQSGGPSAGPASSPRSAASTRGPNASGSTSRLVPWRDGHRPLGVRPQRQARDAQHGRLFLDAAAVGDHERRAAHQRQELQVTQRVHDLDARHVQQPGAAEHRPPPGMQRQHHRQPGGEDPQRIHQSRCGRRRIHVGRPMERRHGVALGDAEARPDRSRVEAVEMRQQGVDHGVADQVHPLGRDALVRQVVDGLRAGHEQQVRQDVRHPSVDLLGHRHIEAPQAGLHVGYRDEQLGAHEGRGKGRVDIPVHDDHGRPVGHELVLQCREQCAGLVALAARPDTQADIGRRQ